ncbi:hypothetical protein Slin15195_G051730 [Septoria linicola]|uniref:Uncharacterized protein n=1 Tax=Septoria linicola TaxID=215465 RepID=A0A9Q9EJ58_9PEZI|nr:hypothetical protein Slin14017_G127230 [Septoria linicola]USW51854.1 hypothetical protein Slin15195_G051730 [Septoria linicola]
MVRLVVLVLVVIVRIKAASFTAWLNDACTEITVDKDQALEPEECFSLAPLSASSFQLSGMQDTNDKGGDRVELYSDQSCQHHTGTMKWSGYCHPGEYRSLKYISPQPRNISEADIKARLEAAERERKEALELDRQLLEVERAFERKHGSNRVVVQKEEI